MISFVMLTWNRKAFVEKLLNSFYEKKSNKHAYEFVVIDNGSTDGTSEFLQKAAAKDQNIKLTIYKKNKGLAAYKKLLCQAIGDYIVIIDDDVIDFPVDFDAKLVNALLKAPEFGYVALDVIQDEFTNGAKHLPELYQEVVFENFVLQEGPTGGWCSILKRTHFKKIKWKFLWKRINMRKGEDGLITKLLFKHIGLRNGILKGERCFHACGPYYSEKFGFLQRDIQKYKDSGLKKFVSAYENYSPLDKK